MGPYADEQGSILIVSAKKEACSFLKSALERFYKRFIYASSMTEAKNHFGIENVFLLFVFTPLPEGNAIDDVLELSDRKTTPSILVVQPDIYPEVLYRTRGRRVYVLTYPTKKGLVLQTVNILCESQIILNKAMQERDKLREKLSDLQIVTRAKLSIMEKKGVGENEAHHYVEKTAMNKGLTKRKAAEYILEELLRDENESKGPVLFDPSEEESV